MQNKKEKKKKQKKTKTNDNKTCKWRNYEERLSHDVMTMVTSWSQNYVIENVSQRQVKYQMSL